jgi:CRISPR-associated endonuclease/helicase Cas3
MSTDETEFSCQFKALNGHDHFPWQFDLYTRFIEGDLPEACSIPTGLGKTSVVSVWLIALANHPEKSLRRLVYVVNRRTVVDQTTNEVEKLRKNLRSAGVFEPLSRLCAIPLEGDDSPLAISTLRGQFADNREWSADPCRSAVIVGTVDMIGSRLLFSGYGVGFKLKPLHAGFLGQDVLLVHDEAHLEPAFQELLNAIRAEQERCKEFRAFRVMALTATSRVDREPFGLTPEERNAPEHVPEPPKTPVEVVWRRLKAKKGVRFHTPEGEKEKVAERIGKLAKKCAETHPGAAILIYVNTLEDHATVCNVLRDERFQVLTGTLRGLERDRLVNEDPIFARFLRKPSSEKGTVYLVCTSAGEVGIDISADHMVCDLTTFDRMAQRFGRVNRFGDGDAEIDIVHELIAEKQKEDDPYERARWETLELLKELPQVGERQSASPLALVQLREREDLKSQFALAYTPLPAILPVTDILFDSWALTTIRGKLPGRPPVEPYLHGLSGWEPPETRVAWRDEVGVLPADLLEQYSPEDLLEDYPLKPHELLRDRSDRVSKHLAALAERKPDAPVWLLAEDGAVQPLTLLELTENDTKNDVNNSTVLLPPQVGGLRDGMMDGVSEKADDVADEWWDEGQNGNRRARRVRVWDDEAVPKDMRLIRTIDIKPDTEEDGDEGEATGRRYWRWYELPQSGDTEGSKAARKAVEWKVHNEDVVSNAKKIVYGLPLSVEVSNAVILAAKFHDLGKRRTRFQRILGNMETGVLLAKSGKRQVLGLREDYRHEFGSLFDVLDQAEFNNLSNEMNEMKDLVLHLIAAHHGRGRPHFQLDEAFEPEPNGKDVSMIAAEVPRRFARLQRKYGRWGLAYLESLLRAADYEASANPSSVMEDEQ